MRQQLDPCLLPSVAAAQDGAQRAGLNEVSAVDTADAHPGGIGAWRRALDQRGNGPRCAHGRVAPGRGGIAGPVARLGAVPKQVSDDQLRRRNAVWRCRLGWYRRTGCLERHDPLIPDDAEQPPNRGQRNQGEADAAATAGGGYI